MTCQLHDVSATRCVTYKMGQRQEMSATRNVSYKKNNKIQVLNVQTDIWIKHALTYFPPQWISSQRKVNWYLSVKYPFQISSVKFLNEQTLDRLWKYKIKTNFTNKCGKNKIVF